MLPRTPFSTGPTAAHATGNTLYVSTAGNDTNDCLTQATACASVGRALIVAGANGSTIDIGPGTFYGPISITTNITLSGQGTPTNPTILDGHAGGTVITAGTGTTAGTGITATVQNVTVQNGVTPGYGGGILVQGNVTVQNSIIQNNQANGSARIVGSGGGGIAVNGGNLTLIGSTVVSNATNNFGGGIDIAQGSARIVNSTISNNTTTGGGGGGVITWGGTSVNISDSTIAYNSTSKYIGNGIYNYGTAIVSGSIVAGNAGDDCLNDTNGGTTAGLMTNAGGNVEDFTGCGFSIQSKNPQFASAAPANNGGPTPTIALNSGSPAIGHGSCTDTAGQLVSTDQRGVARPISGCTAGAFEALGVTTITGPADVNPTLNPLQLSGTAPFGASVSIFQGTACGGSAVASATADASTGTWSATVVPAPTPDGTYVYSVGVLGSSAQCSVNAATHQSATVNVDTAAPSSTIAFPNSTSPLTATDWQNGCNTGPWNASFSICGTTTDAGSGGIAGVLVEIKDADSGLWWNGSACQWQTNVFGNLAVLAGGTGASGGFTSSGGGFTSSGGGFTSSGGGFTSSGGGFTSSGGGFTSSGGGFTSSGGNFVTPTLPAGSTCNSAGGFTSSGGGFTSSGGGFTSSGGGFTSSGGGFTSSGGASVSTSVPWYFPTDLPSNGHYSIVVQAVDNAGNVELGATNTPVLASHPSATVTVAGQIANADLNGGNTLQNVPLGSSINVTFTEPMEPASLNNITLTDASGHAIPVVATCTDSGYCQNVKIQAAPSVTVYASSTSPLTSLTGYTLTIPGGTCATLACPGVVTDQALNGLMQANGATTVTASFTTGDASSLGTTDTDGDGIPDTSDGHSVSVGSVTVNTANWGFSSAHADLCLVEDYMAGNLTLSGGTTMNYDQHITQAANQDIVNAFARHGIHLVIFEGPYSAGLPSGYTDPGYGQQITMTDRLGTMTSTGAYDWTAFDQIRNQYFVPTGLAQFCHFAVIAHTLGGTQASGTSRGIQAGDFLVALGTEPDGVGNEIQQAGTVMHELGHNLGLLHGGNTNTNNKPNYPSVMNYNYQFRGVIGGSSPLGLDYSSGTMAPLNEGSLSDSAGLGASAAGFGTRYWCSSGTGSISNIVADATASINWGCSTTGPLLGTTHSADVNNDGTIGTLTDYNDWSSLHLSGDGTIGFGAGTTSTGPTRIPISSTVDVSPSTQGGVDSVANVQNSAPLFTWTGFLAPLSPDSAGTVINTGKAGRTYPVKFQLQDATGAYVSSLSAVKSITYSTSNACQAGTQDSIEYATTSTAGLHYDSTANQYVYNWNSPSSGGCLLLRVSLVDNTTRQALFKLS